MLVFSVALSAFLVCFLRISHEGVAYYMLLEQVLGFVAISLLYVTLVITLLKRLLGTPGWMQNLLYARRAFGVSTAWFALLHAGISFWRELGGFAGLAILPDKYFWPLVFGVCALVLMVALACISFDRMVLLIGYPRWKKLQRLTYVCGLLVVAHVWTVGVHFSPGIIRDICFVAVAVLFGLESMRIADYFAVRYHFGKVVRYAIFVTLWLVGTSLLLATAFSRTAEAHSMLRDSIAEGGAILHVSPDDNPIAGEPASLVFETQDESMASNRSTAKLVITDDEDNLMEVQASIRGRAVAVDYTFPRQGLYSLDLSVRQGGQETHHFTASQRISRGAINGTATVAERGPPFWAVAGSAGTTITAAIIGVAVFSRRAQINAQSKL